MNNIEINDQEKYYNEYEEVNESIILDTIISEEEENAKTNFQVMLDDELPGNEEVLKLTQYDGGLGIGNTFTSAEYNDIDVQHVQLKHQKLAKGFVNKIQAFIVNFKDVELTKEQKDYVKIVAELQLDNLVDLLSLVDINKQILNNIVKRINSVQAEDYAMVATYNNLITQHLKLIKELQNTYKSIPAVLKKMRTEILCNQELGDIDPKQEEVLTTDSGSSQFNNTRELLKKIRSENEKQ